MEKKLNCTRGKWHWFHSFVFFDFFFFRSVQFPIKSISKLDDWILYFSNGKIVQKILNRIRIFIGQSSLKETVRMHHLSKLKTLFLRIKSCFCDFLEKMTSSLLRQKFPKAKKKYCERLLFYHSRQVFCSLFYTQLHAKLNRKMSLPRVAKFLAR